MVQGLPEALEQEMKISPAHRQYHPKWYRTQVSTYWWSHEWPYLKFMLRELSSVPVAFFVVIILLQLWSLREGRESYLEFQQWLKHPVLIILNGLSFVFVLFHTITWFNLAPKAMVIRWRGKRVPNLLISSPNYVAWVVISGLVILLLTRQG